MTPLNGGRGRRAVGLLLLVTMTLSGCVRWQTHTAPREALGGHQHEQLIIHPLQGIDRYLVQARVAGDSVVGIERIPVTRDDRVSDVDQARGYLEKPYSIALTDVRSVETSSTTVKPIVLFVVITVVLLAIMVGSSWDMDMSSTGSSGGYFDWRAP